MRLGSLFTGAGGLDLATAEVLPVQHSWFVDNDPVATRLLAHHWPEVPNLGDITTVDWHTVEPVDMLTGGFPCQDISNAGKREGITGARSSLWGRFVDAIRLLRPRYVLVENVASLVVRGLDTVLADLAALGLDAEWTVVPASAVGAPHRRERLFLAATNPDQLGPVRPWDTRGWRCGPAHNGVAATDTARDGRGERRPEHAGQRRRPDAAERGAASVADTGREHGQWWMNTVSESPDEWRASSKLERSAACADWGSYAAAIHRWECILGRAAPVPTTTGTRGGQVLNPALAEWMMGLPDGWITHVPGLSRNDMLRLTGNGVVPQQAAAAYRWLLPQLEHAEVAA